jgi:DHA2 family multidrug resistance protein
MAFAVYGAAVVLAPAIGPTLGGYITDHYSWRWVFLINVPVGVVSLLLSSRMVKDPPYIAAERKKLGRFDFLGFFLLALGLGALEVVLDKGQREDWFASAYITWFTIVAVVCLVTFVIWEIFQKNPIVDVKLIAQRNFGTATLMMLTVGAMLYSTTVLLPQYTQTLMGYTAQLAGEALSPGGLLVLAMMPFVGAIVSRVESRKLLAVGFALSSLALFYMAHHLYTGVSFGTIVKLRCYQAAGLAFLFVPINTVAYVGLPQRSYNQASGMINLARNLGGDIGIAAATTILAQRAQLHQTNLAAHTSKYDDAFAARLEGATRALVHAGETSHEAGRKALGAVARAVGEQAESLAYIDTIWLFAILAALMVPLTFVMKRNDPKQAQAAAA